MLNSRQETISLPARPLLRSASPMRRTNIDAEDVMENGGRERVDRCASCNESGMAVPRGFFTLSLGFIAVPSASRRHFWLRLLALMTLYFTLAWRTTPGKDASTLRLTGTGGKRAGSQLCDERPCGSAIRVTGGTSHGAGLNRRCTRLT